MSIDIFLDNCLVLYPSNKAAYQAPFFLAGKLITSQGRIFHHVVPAWWNVISRNWSLLEVLSAEFGVLIASTESRCNPGWPDTEDSNRKPSAYFLSFSLPVLCTSCHRHLEHEQMLIPCHGSLTCDYFTFLSLMTILQSCHIYLI